MRLVRGSSRWCVAVVALRQSFADRTAIGRVLLFMVVYPVVAVIQEPGAAV